MNQEDFLAMLKKNQKDLIMKYAGLNRFVQKGKILFVGSSLMEHFPLNELMMNKGMTQVAYNRGIGGYTTKDLLETMDECIFSLEPSRIFINIGSNDIGTPGYLEENLIDSYRKILLLIKKGLPKTKVTLIAYYPINAEDEFGIPSDIKKMMFATRTNSAINSANQAIEKLAEELKYEFINVNQGLMDEIGNLKYEYSVEGLHMKPEAYDVILDNLKVYLLPITPDGEYTA
jgi:lysophospholipase L1-like esterase